MQNVIRSGMVQVLNDLNRYEAVGYRIPFCYAGNIAKSNEFPSRMEVKDGMLYIVTADTIDGNPEKTNTGKTFEQGQTIIWYYGDWWELSKCSPAIDSYTVLLLHCDGDDGSTVFTDSSGYAHTVITNGNAQIDTARYKFGTGSGLFDGSLDYLSIADSDDFEFGTGPFTLEAWIYPNAINGYRDIISKAHHAVNKRGYNLECHDGKLNFAYSSDGGLGTNYSLTESGTSIIIGSQQHIVAVYDETAIYLYHNGVLVATAPYTGGIFNNGIPVLIGSAELGTANFWDGWIDEVRISKGSARIYDPSDKLYIPSGNPADGFTPPDSPYGS